MLKTSNRSPILVVLQVVLVVLTACLWRIFTRDRVTNVSRASTCLIPEGCPTRVTRNCVFAGDSWVIRDHLFVQTGKPRRQTPGNRLSQPTQPPKQYNASTAHGHLPTSQLCIQAKAWVAPCDAVELANSTLHLWQPATLQHFVQLVCKCLDGSYSLPARQDSCQSACISHSAVSWCSPALTSGRWAVLILSHISFSRCALGLMSSSGC